MKINFKKLFKRVGIVCILLILFLSALIFSLRIPAVQNLVKNQLISYLEKKIQTKVSLEKVYINFPNSLIINNLYLQGQDIDTLLYIHRLDVGLDIPELINNRANLTSIELEKLNANVVRDEKGNFNFDYILNTFATKKEEQTESKPFVISLDKIQLKDIGIRFIDKQLGNNINLYFKSFDTHIQTFDLDKNTYAIGDIAMDGLRLKLKQDLVQEVAKKIEQKADSLSQKSPLSIGLKEILLTNFDIDYEDKKSNTKALVKFSELKTKVNKLNLEQQKYDIEQIALSNADILTHLHLPKTSEKKEEKEVQTNAPIELLLKKLKLKNVKLAYHNNAISPNSQGMDFNHLNFNPLNLEVSNFKMQNNTFSGRIAETYIKEEKGLYIKELKIDFAYNDQQAYLKNLYLETPKTLLRNEVVLNYHSIEELAQNIGNVNLSLNLSKSKIAFSDILLLAPQLRKTTPFNKYPNAVLSVHSRVKGKLNDLSIPYFQLSGIGDIKADVSGNIKNATQPEKIFYDLKIRELTASKKSIHQLLPANTLPNNIHLPEKFTLKGNAKGSTKIVHSDLAMQSTSGNVEISANLNMQKENAETYDIKAQLHQLQLGNIIGNNKIGSISGKISAQGKSFNPKQAIANIKADIYSAKYNNYTYRNIHLDSRIANKKYNIAINSKDENANLNLVANGIYNEQQPSLNLKGNINRLNLHTLGFYDKPMGISGNIDGNFTNLSPEAINGNMALKHFVISDEQDVYRLQDIILESEATANANRLSLQSQIVDIEMNGKYKINQISDALLSTLNEYYPLQKKSAKKYNIPHQYFSITAKVKNDDLIRKFVPELTSFETISLDGNFDSNTKQIKLNANIPSIVYGKNKVQNIIISIDNPKESLDYSVHIDGFSNESIALNKVDISGNIINSIIQYAVSVKDNKNTEQFLIAGNAKTLGEITEISLNPDGLKLNYNQWKVAENNKLQLAKNGIWAENFALRQNGSEISIDSESKSPASPLNINIKDFKIETLTEFIKKDSLLAQGTINGNLQITNPTKNMGLTSDLNIKDLFILGNPIGDINANIKNQNTKIFNADIRLSGNQNDANIVGSYNAENLDFNADIYINRLEMKTAEAFAMGNIAKTQGYLSGKLNASGTPKQPIVIGNIKFNQVGLLIPKTGSELKNINDQINFTDKGIEFHNFGIYDSDNNALSINGKIITQNYQTFKFDLGLKAEDFKVVNSEQYNNALTYGILAIDARLKIGGDMDLPTVDGKISVTDKTDFTFVLPQSSPSLQEREGIVEFIDSDKIALQKTIKTDSISSQSKIKGLDANVNIEINRAAKTSILIDKANGDFVKIQGKADLNGGIDPSGKTTLTGVFQIEEGAYEMSVSLLKRKFEIQKGSTITWTGEPTAAILDITAIYKTQAAPIDLLQQQLTGISTSEMNTYKQQIPFNTHLILKGELLKPEISFDIQLNDENPSVATSVIDNTKVKLSQLRNEESEMNKQVFALLLLNRFIGENPFQSQAGTSASTMAIQSVSGLLSQQLNNLAADLIQGVDLDFGLDTTDDYSTGTKNTRTDLNVKISKRLLNDRLKVSIGSDFGLDGEARQNEKMTNIAGDVNIDYMLSKDGRYILRAYRKNKYQVALQGQIIETGVGFIITIDYNEFKEIFRRTK